MGSTRLPGKAMKLIMNRPLLYYVINQVRHCTTLSKIIIATTTLKEDDQIVRHVKSLEMDVYRGSAEDVLSRYYYCAKDSGIDTIVRVTSDNPFTDPRIIDRCVIEFENSDLDYLSNVIKKEHDSWVYDLNGFPYGLAVEVFSFKALAKAWKDAKNFSDREHVTPYIINNSQLFSLGNITNSDDFSNIRVTVDHRVDFDIAKTIIEHFPKDHVFSMNDVVLFLKQNPKLALMNSKLPFNEGYLQPQKEDKLLEKD